MVPWICLQFVFVVFPDHAHLLFLTTECLTFLLIFRFSCSNFRGHFIGQNFKTYFSSCVWFKHKSNSEIFRKFETKTAIH